MAVVKGDWTKLLVTEYLSHWEKIVDPSPQPAGFHCVDLGDEVLAPMDFLADLYPQSWEYTQTHMQDEMYGQAAKEMAKQMTEQIDEELYTKYATQYFKQKSDWIIDIQPSDEIKVYPGMVIFLDPSEWKGIILIP